MHWISKNTYAYVFGWPVLSCLTYLHQFMPTVKMTIGTHFIVNKNPSIFTHFELQHVNKFEFQSANKQGYFATRRSRPQRHRLFPPPCINMLWWIALQVKVTSVMIFFPRKYFITEIIINILQYIEVYLKEWIKPDTQTFTENENIDTFRLVYKNILMHQKFPIDVQIKYLLSMDGGLFPTEGTRFLEPSLLRPVEKLNLRRKHNLDDFAPNHWFRWNTEFCI